MTMYKALKEMNSFGSGSFSRHYSSTGSLLSEADVPLYEGSLVATTAKKSKKTSGENRSLLQSLVHGRVLIGEYNAQLALDNIQLTQVLKEREQTQSELKAKYDQLEARLTYFFEDCKRLSSDNEEIVKEGALRDKELAELYSQLELQESKLRGTKKGMFDAQTKHDKTMNLKTKSQTTYMTAKEKLVRQHQQLWQTQDMVDYLREEVTQMQKILHSIEKKRLAPLSGEALSSSGSASKSGAVAVISSSVMFSSSDAEAEAARQGKCQRKDCAELRKHLKAVNAEIQRYVKQQRLRSSRSTSFFGSRSQYPVSPTASREEGGAPPLSPSSPSSSKVEEKPLVTPQSSSSVSRGSESWKFTPSSLPLLASPVSIRSERRKRLGVD